MSYFGDPWWWKERMKRMSTYSYTESTGSDSSTWVWKDSNIIIDNTSFPNSGIIVNEPTITYNNVFDEKDIALGMLRKLVQENRHDAKLMLEILEILKMIELD